MRLLNVTLDENKGILGELTKIYGIGFNRSKKILNFLNIDYLSTIKNLSEEKKEQLKNLILEKEKNFGNALKRSINNNFKREIALKSYKGSRYKNKLPVRGQRTRTNSKTAKKGTFLLEIL
jgi:small subunit ribosomal protein S13